MLFFNMLYHLLLSLAHLKIEGYKGLALFCPLGMSFWHAVNGL